MTPSTFLLLLKLGLWHSGHVQGWGRVEYLQPTAACPLPPVKKQLGIGIYLHGLYLLQSVVRGQRRVATFVMVISECRLRGAFEEKTHILKVTNALKAEEFKQLVYDSAPQENRYKIRRHWGSIRQPQSHDNGVLAVNRRH